MVVGARGPRQGPCLRAEQGLIPIFQQVLFTKAQRPASGTQNPFPSKNRAQSEVCSFVSPITATVKKKVLLNTPQYTRKLLYEAVVGVPIVGVFWANV